MKLIDVIEFSSTDCSDTHLTVSIIVKSLHRAGKILDSDNIEYRDDGEKVRIYIYRSTANGCGGDGQM